jgi:GNAT superfamily N-acetyltransferase
LIAEFHEVDGHQFDRDTVLRGLVHLLDSDEHGIVLITEGGHAVLVWRYRLESGAWDALLDEIYVWDRGRGIGTALLEQVFVEMWDRDISRIFLETEAGNHRARAFYARSGFRVENSVWMSADLG